MGWSPWTRARSLVAVRHIVAAPPCWCSERASGTAPDPLTALAYAAGRTEKLKLGTSVQVLPGRNPLLLAKQWASLDRLSNGRALPAFGLGVVLAHFAGLTPLEGYLATSPGGVYAVLATAVETGSNVTFIIATQVVRILLMLFAAPLLARAVVRVGRRFDRQSRATTPASKEPILVADCRPASSTSS